jgi:prepilin-type N-terminal cleavage/methylation domain-containing protein
MRALEKNIKGFNVLELIVVVVIIGLISALAFPNISSWTKERETRNAAQKIKTLMTNINSQVQRGKYGFVQVFIQDLTIGTGSDTKQVVIVKSKGMKMNTLMTKVNNGDHEWNDDDGNTKWCDADETNTDYWDDVGSEDGTVSEVGYFMFENIAVNFREKIGAVCFSTDGTWYSGAEEFSSESIADSEVSVDSLFFLCVRKENESVCEIGESDGIPSTTTKENNQPIFAVSWSRFGNITLEKWSNSQDDWILQ